VRNKFPGICYRCFQPVPAGSGHFERYRGGWITQHADCAIRYRAPLVQSSFIVHCKKEPYDIYIGRPSIWGNPFSHLDGKGRYRVANRALAIQCYRDWVWTQPELLMQVHTLKNRVLGCWCFPLPCHGSVLIELTNLIPDDGI